MRFNTQPPEGGWSYRRADFVGRCEFQHTAVRRRLVRNLYKRFSQPSVSTHSRPKAAGLIKKHLAFTSQQFQHTAARRRLVENNQTNHAELMFQHTAARRRLGFVCCPRKAVQSGFNTQPPEGGWVFSCCYLLSISCFNTQPPEGGWGYSYRHWQWA